MVGGFGNDFILGNDGDDFIRGRGGVDTIYGGGGDDIIRGGGGDDFLSGDRGNDLIRVAVGNDTVLFNITGAAGNDRFEQGADTILDFQAGAGNDKIALIGSGADYGDLSFAQVGSDTQISYDGVLMATLTLHTFTGNALDYYDVGFTM